MTIKLLFPTIYVEKKSEALLGQDLIETNISFPTQLNLQTWSNSVILIISVLGFGVRIYWRYNEQT